MKDNARENHTKFFSSPVRARLKTLNTLLSLAAADPLRQFKGIFRVIPINFQTHSNNWAKPSLAQGTGKRVAGAERRARLFLSRGRRSPWLGRLAGGNAHRQKCE